MALCGRILAAQRLAHGSSISYFPYSSFKFTQQSISGIKLTSKLRILMSSATTLETKFPVVEDVDFKSLTNDDWKKRLSPEQFAVCRLGGTELCNSHLGHLFADGPPPVGNSFCVNSVALDFFPSTDAAEG